MFRPDMVEIRHKQRRLATPKAAPKRSSKTRIKTEDWQCSTRGQYDSWLKQVDAQTDASEGCLVCGECSTCGGFEGGGYQAQKVALRRQEEKQFIESSEYLDRTDLRHEDMLQIAAHEEVLQVALRLKAEEDEEERRHRHDLNEFIENENEAQAEMIRTRRAAEQLNYHCQLMQNKPPLHLYGSWNPGYDRQEFLGGVHMRSFNVNPTVLPNTVPHGKRSIHESVARRQFSFVGNIALPNSGDFARFRKDERGPIQKLKDAGFLPAGNANPSRMEKEAEGGAVAKKGRQAPLEL